jgi:hypothetical protein
MPPSDRRQVAEHIAPQCGRAPGAGFDDHASGDVDTQGGHARGGDGVRHASGATSDIQRRPGAPVDD